MRIQVRLLVLLLAYGVASLQAQAPVKPLADLGSQPRPSPATPFIPRTIPPLPPAAAQRLGSLMPRLQPSVRSWIQDQVLRQRNLPVPDLESVRSAARMRFTPPTKMPPTPAANQSATRVVGGKPLSSLSAGAGASTPGVNLSAVDIETLAQLVMAQCAKESEADLAAMLSDMQKRQKQKAELRELAAELRKERGNSPANDAPCASPSCRALERRLWTLAAQLPAKARFSIQPIAKMGDLNGVDDKLEASQASLDEMTEETSMRLQQAMDRRDKFIATLSNLLKKSTETSDGIIANLK